MTRYFALIVGLGVYAAPVFAQGGDFAAAVAAIKEADKEWLVAATAKDLERTVSFWTDDAVIYPPGQPAVTGKDAIRRYVADGFKQTGFSVSWQSAEPVVSKSGDMAYTLGTNQFTFQDPNGNLVTVRGRGVVVWRRQRDGRWKCAVDTWNAEPVPGPPASKDPR
jgi:ketosteroid isomerase-like protein